MLNSILVNSLLATLSPLEHTLLESCCVCDILILLLKKHHDYQHNNVDKLVGCATLIINI